MSLRRDQIGIVEGESQQTKSQKGNSSTKKDSEKKGSKKKEAIKPVEIIEMQDSSKRKSKDLLEDDSKFIIQDKERYSTPQWLSQQFHRGAVVVTGVVAVNWQFQGIIPQPYQTMMTFASAPIIAGLHDVLHAGLKNEDPLRYLREYGNVFRGALHEAAKFTIAVIPTAAMGYGLGRGVMYFGPVLAESTKSAAQGVSFALNNPFINMAVLGFTGWVASGGIKWAYEKIVKAMPDIGPEVDSQTRYLQSLGAQLGLRLAKDIAALTAFKVALVSFGLGALLDRPEVVLFMVAFDQLIAEPSRYAGYTYKPGNKLVGEESAPDGYERLPQALPQARVNVVAPEDDPLTDFDVEEQTHKNTFPAKSDYAKAAGWYFSRTGFVTGLSLCMVGLVYANNQFANAMGFGQQGNEADRTLFGITLTGTVIAGDRLYENAGPVIVNRVQESSTQLSDFLKKSGTAIWQKVSGQPQSMKAGVEEPIMVRGLGLRNSVE